jgi:hypothetical protein
MVDEYIQTHVHFLFALAADHLWAESPQSDWLEQVASRQQGSVHLYLTELVLLFPFYFSSCPPEI